MAVYAAGQTFSLQGDVLSLLQTAAAEELPSALPDKVLKQQHRVLMHAGHVGS